jgi:3-deoxy-manno-octulosonate cytidylyltransferase (CMP-KDO synthetase)
MNFLGIIPARYGSTRLEGKPLVDIAGKPMIQWVYEETCKALDTVYVATDDDRIADVVRSFGGNVVMTSADHQNGTTRCLEAWNLINALETRTFDAALNIQGDEPMLDAGSLEDLKNCFAGGETDFATLVIPVTTEEDLWNDSEVFVTFNKHMDALYFSRSVIPAIRGRHKMHWLEYGTFYKHLGLYAYTFKTLQAFANMAPSTLENYESLEQLRWIENGGSIKIGITEHESIPVDTMDDLKRVREIMAKRA